MDKYLLHVLANEPNFMLKDILSGIEEQGIQFKVMPLEDENKIDLNKVPFNLIIVVKEHEAYLVDRDIKNCVDIRVKNIFDYGNKNNSKKLKNFGLDMGRYIKGIPLKGDWNESK